MQISANFSREEFEHNGKMPDDAVASYQNLCRLLLEPIRQQFSEPILITSGYRSPGDNAAAHGVPDSQHVATDRYCAADWYVPSHHHDMRPVFDFIRKSNLPFDQLILEHGSVGDVIHLSWSVENRRVALEGKTANQSAYQSWTVEGEAA